ncbi:MAG TPA: class I SAM-dependent methyltransferase [Candidatus Binataceae bacterium]|nr:class I SAM-dependent methyltransferase [Candidatus Binataceae bacterium]
MRRQINDFAKRVLFRVHRLGLRAGIIVTPVHYYGAMPNLLELERTRDRWAQRSTWTGVGLDANAQAEQLAQICAPFEAEYRGNQVYLDACRSDSGPGFGYLEAQALYGAIRHFRPPQIIEVGSGVSTKVALAAIARNGNGSRVTCIEPHPRPWLRSAGVTLIDKPVQDVPVSLFREKLGKDCLLFIDSSHAVKTGSDVNYLILEVLPALASGVIVHLHDIYFPYDYPRDTLTNFLGSTQECAMLHAFLIGNARVRILFSLSLLHYDRPEVLQRVFPEYRPQSGRDGLRDEHSAAGHFPSSIYLQML